MPPLRCRDQSDLATEKQDGRRLRASFGCERIYWAEGGYDRSGLRRRPDVAALVEPAA